MLIRTLLIAAALAATGPARAQAVPTSEFYFDADGQTTQAVIAVEGEGEQRLQRLLDLVQNEPRPKAATAQLAHLAMVGGRPDLGRELYDRALGWLDISHGLYRTVLWNYGWDLYRIGDHAGALAQWRTLRTSRDIDATWMPQTFALVLWTLGHQDEAVVWYAAAVRSEPGKWRDADHFAELLPDWREDERAVLAQVHAAWAANPPSWNQGVAANPPSWN